MAEQQPHMRQFLLYVFVLLIPCFVLWHVTSGTLAAPAVGLVHLALTNWFPDVVNGLFLDGTEALLMTEFGEKKWPACSPGQRRVSTRISGKPARALLLPAFLYRPAFRHAKKRVPG